MTGPQTSRPRLSPWWLVLAAAFLVAIFLAPLASRLPDGLERTVQDHGQGTTVRERPQSHALLPGYTVPGFTQSRAGTALAGLAGTLLTLGVGCGLAALLAHKKGPGGRSSW